MKAARLVPILPALILAACHGQPAPPVATVAPEPPGPAQGVDLARDASDFLNELKSSHIDFVARYYRDPASRFPALSPNEARQLSSAGLKLVTVWEWHSHDPGYFSYSTGYSDANAAYSEAKSVGQPPGSAIYFAVDFDARGAALGPVDDYFRGIAAGLAAASGGRPEYKVGVYGSGAVCDAVKQAGLAQYAWLSNSIGWQGSIYYDDWNIRQGGAWPDLSFEHDSDEAKADYGGFSLDETTVATRERVPPPAAAPVAPQESRAAATEIAASR